MLRGRLLQLAFDFALDAPRGAPHVHGQRGHRDGRDERQNAFPQRLVGGAGKEPAGDDAEDHRNGDAPLHGRHQMPAAALAQIREADGDDEEGLEAFAKRDDECLQHGMKGRPSALNEMQISTSSVFQRWMSGKPENASF